MSTPEAEGTLPSRWFGPGGSRRFHYFDEGLRALCGKWMLWRDPVEAGLEWGVAIGPADGDCVECKRRLDKVMNVVHVQDKP